MATELKKPIERALRETDNRNKPLLMKATIEGVYMKIKGQHWDTAVLMPWGAIYTQGCIRKAVADKEQKKRDRDDKKLGI